MNGLTAKPRRRETTTAIAGGDQGEADFNRERDLAAAMLEEAGDVQMNNPDAATPYRTYRYGKVQAPFPESIPAAAGRCWPFSVVFGTPV